eukprot:4491323-Alexandrium_andersonii.AAC.1
MCRHALAHTCSQGLEPSSEHLCRHALAHACSRAHVACTELACYSYSPQQHTRRRSTRAHICVRAWR